MVRSKAGKAGGLCSTDWHHKLVVSDKSRKITILHFQVVCYLNVAILLLMTAKCIVNLLYSRQRVET
jgi:hypothetical protein